MLLLVNQVILVYSTYLHFLNQMRLNRYKYNQIEIDLNMSNYK